MQTMESVPFKIDKYSRLIGQYTLVSMTDQILSTDPLYSATHSYVSSCPVVCASHLRQCEGENPPTHAYVHLRHAERSVILNRPYFLRKYFGFGFSFIIISRRAVSVKRQGQWCGVWTLLSNG